MSKHIKNLSDYYYYYYHFFTWSAETIMKSEMFRICLIGKSKVSRGVQDDAD